MAWPSRLAGSIRRTSEAAPVLPSRRARAFLYSPAALSRRRRASRLAGLFGSCPFLPASGTPWIRIRSSIRLIIAPPFSAPRIDLQKPPAMGSGAKAPPHTQSPSDLMVPDVLSPRRTPAAFQGATTIQIDRVAIPAAISTVPRPSPVMPGPVRAVGCQGATEPTFCFRGCCALPAGATTLIAAPKGADRGTGRGETAARPQSRLQDLDWGWTSEHPDQGARFQRSQGRSGR